MYPNQLLDPLSLNWVFFLTVFFATLSIEIGYQIGTRSTRTDDESYTPLTTSAWITNSIFAFMITFTFSMAASNVNLRKRLVVEEANAIRTAYLDAGLIQEPHRTKAREMLREYLDIRLKAALEKVDGTQALSRSAQLQKSLWIQAVEEKKTNPDLSSALRFSASVQKIFDVHTERLTAVFENRIKNEIWISLDLLAVISLISIGYLYGLDRKRRWVSLIALILSISIVRLLVVGLDRPSNGISEISQNELITLQNDIDTN